MNFLVRWEMWKLNPTYETRNWSRFSRPFSILLLDRGNVLNFKNFKLSLHQLKENEKIIGTYKTVWTMFIDSK